MSSYTRKMSETIRVAENTKKLLFRDAHKNSYNEGLYDGFNMVLTLLTGLEFKTFKEVKKAITLTTAQNCAE